MTSRSECRSLVARIFDELGGRASAEDIIVHLNVSAPPELHEYLRDQGWQKVIGEFFRSKSTDGLPVAPEVGDGVHVQLELLALDDFKWVITRQMQSSKASRVRAEQYRDRCYDQWGVLIDLDEIEAAS